MPATIIRDVALERNQFVRTAYFTNTKVVQIDTTGMNLGSKWPSVIAVPLDSAAFPIYKAPYNSSTQTVSVRLISAWTGGCEVTITKRY